MVVIVYTKSYKYHHQHYLNCQIVKCWILDSVDNLLWKSISLTSLNFAINQYLFLFIPYYHNKSSVMKQLTLKTCVRGPRTMGQPRAPQGVNPA